MRPDSINKAEALRYMGQRGESTPALEHMMDRCEQVLLESIDYKYVYRVFELDFTHEGVRLEGTGLVLRGNDIRSHLSGCDKAALMCVTLGQGCDRAIRKLSLSDIAEGFAADALGSAAVENVCDIAEREIRKRFPGKYFTWRFSPGYGDLPIEQQRDFLAVTDAAKRINLSLSDGGMMIPSKSVTAIIGIGDTPVDSKKKGCGSCNMAATCLFRQKGIRCSS